MIRREVTGGRIFQRIVSVHIQAIRRVLERGDLYRQVRDDAAEQLNRTSLLVDVQRQRDEL